MRQVTLDDIDALLRDVTSSDMRRAADATLLLQGVQTKVRLGLDAARGHLRAYVGPAGGVVNGARAHVRVDPAVDVIRVKKGEEAALRHALGDRFGEFFRVVETVVPVPHVAQALLDLAPETRDAVFACIEIDTDAGAVHVNPRA